VSPTVAILVDLIYPAKFDDGDEGGGGGGRF
jgi:hypothetical protein